MFVLRKTGRIQYISVCVHKVYTEEKYLYLSFLGLINSTFTDIIYLENYKYYI